MPNWCGNDLVIKGTDRTLRIIYDIIYANNFLFGPFVPIKGDMVEECVKKWGTKWDIHKDDFSVFTDVDSNGRFVSIELVFNSAWSPPLEFVVALAKRYSSCSFSLIYGEPGGDFAGIFEIIGDTITDICDSADAYNPMNIYLFGEETVLFDCD